MSDKDIQLEVDGKGSVRIPWKVILLVCGIMAAGMGIQEDAFQAILDTIL